MSTYVALGGNGWGKGDSIASAKREARKHAVSFSGKPITFTVVEVPAPLEVTSVDDMGRLHWKHTEGGDAWDGFDLILVVEDGGKPVTPAVALGKWEG